MKIGIVAGNRIEKLMKYLDLKEELTIKFSCKFLVDIEDALKDSIYELDKIIILDNHTPSQMREDTLLLLELLKQSKFFQVDKIEFITKEGEDENSKFFRHIMKEIKTVDYRINLDITYSLSSVYNYILGNYKEVESNNNTFKNIYLKRKGNSDNFEKVEKDRDNLIKKQDRDTIEKYENLKTKIYNSLSTEIIDRTVRGEVFSKVELKNKELKRDSEDTKSDITVITGLPSSGKSTITIALATSASNLDKTTIILDLQKNNSTTGIAEVLDIDANILYIKDIGSIKDIETWIENVGKGLNIISFKDSKISSESKYLLVNSIILENLEDRFTIIDFPFNESREYYKIMSGLKRLIFTSSSRFIELNQLHDEIIQKFPVDLNQFKDASKTVILNKVYNDNLEAAFMQYSQAKELFSGYKISKELNLTGLDVDENLANALLGGK